MIALGSPGMRIRVAVMRPPDDAADEHRDQQETASTLGMW